MTSKRPHSESGFTLIELLTIIALIGVLAALSINSFSLYRASAAYAVASTTLRNARSAFEAAVADPDHPPAAVPVTTQSASGGMNTALARALLPGMQMPKNLTMEFEYDPTCIDATCQEIYIQAKHCAGKEYIRWIRFGDGLDTVLEHIAGAGC